MADALTSICLDSLTGGSEGREVTVAEVFVDASLAASSLGETGVTLSSGLRAGPATLSEILCTGQVRVIFQGGDGRPVGATDLTEAVPPRTRSYVWMRDQGVCTIAGCRSRYRLQLHHIHERSAGGDHHPDNLTLLCWFHHHVAVHGLGMILASLFLMWGREAWHTTQLMVEPVYFVSGLNFPVASLGMIGALAVATIPLAVGLDAMRQLAFVGTDVGLLPPLTEAGILVVMTVVFTLAARWSLRTLERRARIEGRLTMRWQ
jgi:hypothetical protein